MKHLLIVGAGGFGREMFAAARGADGFGTQFDIRGFLDARPGALASFHGYPPVVGNPADYVPQPDDILITALGDIASRRKCAEALAARGAAFATIVHRTANIGPNVTIGEGSFIAPCVTLTADIAVGRHACVFHNTSVGHDSVLGDFSHVYAQCAVGGGVVIGEGARVFPGSVIVPRRRLGADATVAAGSTVFLNVPAGTTVHGNPACPISEKSAAD